MGRVPISIPPGLKPRATTQATGKQWWDMSLVRWNGAELTPVGGWTKLPNMQLTAAVRGLLSWRDNSAERWIAAASLGEVVVYDTVGHNITPSDFQAGVPGDLVDGYGIGAYGVGLYGTPRIPDVAFNPRGAPGDTTSLANWGENLVVCGSADNRILWWIPDATVSTILVPVPPATPLPTETAGIVHVVPRARYAFVTDERCLVAIGADGDPRRVSWSDQERPGAFTPDIVNLAGSLQLNSTGAAWAARKVPSGYLIFCDDDVHLMQWVGPPFAYGIVRIGTGCSSISPQAIVATAQRTVWMGQETFWIHEGVPRVLACDLQDRIFSNLNRNTQGRTVAAQNGLFPEVWFFYPDNSSVEPNRYAAWNYQANIWIGGLMARTGVTEPGAYGVPLMGDVNGFVYAHENGWTADGTMRGSTVFAETGDMQLGEGDAATCVRAFIPDARNQAQMQLHVFGQWEPEDVMQDFGVFPYTRTDGIIDALFEVRAMRLRVEGVDPELPGQVQPWALGRIRMDAVPGSGR